MCTGCRPLTEAEIQKALEAFQGRYALRNRALFIVGLKTGFRISELLSLRVGDVREFGEILERITVARKDMKQHTASRTIFLHAAARDALATWLAELEAAGEDVGPHTFLFRGQKQTGRPLSRNQGWWVIKQAFAAAGIGGKTGTHSMRKSFAAGIHQAFNGDLRKTAAGLGHKNVNSTVSYLSFEETELDDAIRSL